MSLVSAFTAPFIWIWDAAFGTFRPLLNPFIGNRPLSATGISAMMEAPRMIQRRPRQGGIFRGFNRSETETTNIPPKSAIWQPAIPDVIKTRKILRKASGNQLPLELMNSILDYAEYWPHVSAAKEKPIKARGNTDYEDVLVLRTPPICALATAGCEDESQGLPEPTLQNPARKVVFRIRSRDQGWSGEDPETKGTYSPSYTWFDAEIDKEFGPMADDEPFSRIPWELSSTRFLDVWPEHSHSQEENEAEKAKIADKTLHRKPSDDHHTDAGPLSEHDSRDEEQPEASNNPEHPESPNVRLFSHQYLKNHKYEVQYNVQSKPDITEHTVEWRWTDDMTEDHPDVDELRRIGRGKATGDGRFVRCLQAGDCVSLWAKARYPHWENRVETATVEVYFAI